MKPERHVIARLANFIQTVAGTLGGPGLALLAFADSSFISLPEVADILLVVQVVKDPQWWWYYGVLVTVGSVAGCFVLYELARRGGEAFLKKGFSQATIDKSFKWFQRYGILAIILPSIMQPALRAGPMPPCPRSSPSAPSRGTRLRCPGRQAPSRGAPGRGR